MAHTSCDRESKYSNATNKAAVCGAVAGGAAVGGYGISAAAVALANSLGFTSAGTAAGSWGAGMMASAGVVESGSAIAALQSIGATGSLGYLGAGIVAVVGGGAVVGGILFAVAFLKGRDYWHSRHDPDKDNAMAKVDTSVYCMKCGRPIQQEDNEQSQNGKDDHGMSSPGEENAQQVVGDSDDDDTAQEQN
mmetsp:Transcript_865/g.1108  ORF Transcript_865/g.1108 Transcript_865/m.1108 type:complete len:192 (+) Transcript_865:275-850(+)